MALRGILLNPWRLEWYPRFALFAVCAALFISVLAGRGAESMTGRLGADFPAFYGAGLAVKQGEGKDLYSPAHQSKMQTGLFPPGKNADFMPFPYPAFVAPAYYPFTLLPYRLAFLLHSLLMIAAAAIAAYLLSRENAFVRKHYDVVLAAFVLYYPLLRSELGGQNSSITLLLFVGVWLCNLRRKELIGGVLLGLMLFKPQYGIPLIGLHLLSGRWRMGAVGGLAGLFLYALGAYCSGPFWVIDWFRYASWVSGVAASVDGPDSVSWLGFLQSILGTDSASANIIGSAMAALTVLMVSLVWYRGRHDHDPTAHFAVAAPALLLMQPHAMYYDMGLILFTYAIALSHTTGKSGAMIASLWILGFSQILGRFVGFSPLFLILLLSGLMAGGFWLQEARKGSRNELPLSVVEEDSCRRG